MILEHLFKEHLQVNFFFFYVTYYSLMNMSWWQSLNINYESRRINFIPIVYIRENEHPFQLFRRQRWRFWSPLQVTIKEDGVRGLGKGWAPTAIGYSMQGICKFGFYEVFKSVYGDAIGEENAYLYRTYLYLAASASAEFFADIALAPMEAVKVGLQLHLNELFDCYCLFFFVNFVHLKKNVFELFIDIKTRSLFFLQVRIQTQPGFVSTLREGAPLIYKDEGLNGFYKGLVPLWCRQIPYTMMKFACFEKTVEMLYKYVVPKPRDSCTKSEQLVSFSRSFLPLSLVQFQYALSIAFAVVI